MLPDLIEMLLTFQGLALSLAKLSNTSTGNLHQGIYAFSRNGTGEEHLRVQRAFSIFIATSALNGIAAHFFFEAASGVFHTRGIYLISHHDARTLCQFRQISLQLIVDNAVILYRVAALIPTTWRMIAQRST